MNIANGSCRLEGHHHSSKGPGIPGLRLQAACPDEGQKKSDFKIIFLVFSSVNGSGFISL